MSVAASTKPLIDYPDSDGEPMSDSMLHFDWISILKWNTDWYFRDDPLVFVAAANLIYAVEGEPAIRQGPDDTLRLVARRVIAEATKSGRKAICFRKSCLKCGHQTALWKKWTRSSSSTKSTVPKSITSCIPIAPHPHRGGYAAIMRWFRSTTCTISSARDYNSGSLWSMATSNFTATITVSSEPLSK